MKVTKEEPLQAPGISGSCVIVVENLPVPLDRRVWQEANALLRAGMHVSVICPATDAFPLTYEEIDGISIYRHSLPLEASGRLGFLIEYALALFHEFRLLIKIYRKHKFSIIQGCNPPDLIFLAALPFKLLGVRYIFDQHDLGPELYHTKFKRKDIFYNILRFVEYLSYKTADIVITANETFRDRVLSSGALPPDKVVPVYSIPDKKRIYRTGSLPELNNGKKIVLGYIGIIGDQDGVDYLISAVGHLVNTLGYCDFQCVIVGDGPALMKSRKLVKKLKVEEYVVFTGYLTGQDLMSYLSSFDIGVIPDPMNETNDKMSMNKVFEYSALGIPTVAFPLTETVRLLGETGTYAEGPEANCLAEACLTLMQNDELRRSKAESALRLSVAEFQWVREERKYVSAYRTVLDFGVKGMFKSSRQAF